MMEHSRHTKRHPKNNEERTKLERSSSIALHVLETEHHVDFDKPEILPKYWPIYRAASLSRWKLKILNKFFTFGVQQIFCYQRL